MKAFICAVAAVVGVCAPIQAATVVLWPTTGTAMAVSADGRTVAGSSGSPQPVWWTAAGGLVALPQLSGTSGGQVLNMTPDGTTMVGEGFGNSGNRAFVWSQATGTEALSLPGSGISLSAGAISSDGNVIFGVGTAGVGSSSQFVRWVNGSPTTLGYLGSGIIAQARDCSADCSVMAGFEYIASPAHNTAVVWSQSGGLRDLGTLPGTTSSIAWSVRPDGNEVYGSSYVEGSPDWTDRRAWRWTQSGGMQEVAGMSHVMAASTDGTRLVGATAYDADTRRIEAAIWENGTIINVARTLSDEGLSLGPGWYPQVVTGMSDDGSVLAGEATNGTAEVGFVITGFTMVPEPVATAGLLVASLGLLLRKRA